MELRKTLFTVDTFAFFKALTRNNKTEWMEKNRERYREAIVYPFRQLLEELTPHILDLNDRFDVSGRTGANFSRINRDIRFAKDKTPYRPQMYLKITMPSAGDRESGQLFVGVSAETVTVGFRIYSGPKRKESSLALVAEPRIAQKPKWVGEQRKRLEKKFDSYWYVTEKGEWTKNEGWPVEPENWKKIQGWVVRKRIKPGDALKAGFTRDVERLFDELYPLLRFTSLPE